jgi:hypothetical protein
MAVPMIRTSEERDFKRCKQKWHWGWREGLRPRGEESRDALWFGTGIHLALARWYVGPGARRGVHPAETWAEYSKGYLGGVKLAFMSEEDVARMETFQNLGRVLMEEYVKLYGEDSHKLYIQAEQTFSLDIPWPKDDPLKLKELADSGEILAQWKGTFDGAWRDERTGLIWLDEHKTAKAISTAHLPLDPQASKYWAVATGTLRSMGKIGPTDILTGIEYNFIKKALPDDRPTDREGYACNKPIKKHYTEAFARHGIAVSPKETLETLEALAEAEGLTVLGDRSKVQPGPLFLREQVVRTRKERGNVLRGMQNTAYEMSVYRRGLLPITITPDRDCSGMCNYYDMCVLTQQGSSGSAEEYRNLQYVETDPYADHTEVATEQ